MVSWMTEACKTCRFRLNRGDGECIFCRTRNDLVLYIQIRHALTCKICESGRDGRFEGVRSRGMGMGANF